ncbi:hypothetical protein ONS95_011089 [Cadophora gregata]|uniref:uncharacterized protein n=1 Tax=Cadophora gregata TaxID=51156 RepID=UPI0026DD2094|nr:uncharacterized protein ONS95_011089 [Cadophora gregata]KAK0119651.1 hypothetical protein ONS95_011089 [Cadophora gregata]KAK0120687.1 hypothetical protein ONS96_010889 [Cadophora gregata f. sp. sojae]
MEQSTAGTKPAKIGEAVKERWPDKEIAKGAISGLIARQNKKKTTTQGKGKSLRETSSGTFVSARFEIGEPSLALSASISSESKESSKIVPGSPSVSETSQPQLRPTTSIQKSGTPSASPQITPFSAFKTPPHRYSSPTASDLNEDNATKSECGLRSQKKNHSNVSAPRELPSPGDESQNQERRSSAAQFLERIISLSPGDGCSGSNFLRASESPDKSNPSPEPPVLSLDSIAARGLIKGSNLSFFCDGSGSDSAVPALNTPNFPSEVNPNQIGGSSGSYSPAVGEKLYSPQPRPATTEPFPAFDNETADHLLNKVTPAPSTTYFDPDLAASSFQADDAAPQANTNLRLDKDELETVMTNASAEAKEEVIACEKIETEVQITAPAQETETEFVEPVHADQNLDSTPVQSPQIAISNLDITPRAPQLNLPASKDLSSVRPPKTFQPRIWSTPKPVKMSTLSSTLGSEIVHFYVGPKRKEFIIHGNPLRLKSSYFKDFKFTVHADTGETEHYLPDADSTALEIIIDWVYRQAVEVIPSTLPSGSLDHGTDEHAAFTKAISRGIEVYMLAAKFGVVDLQDLVMTELGKAYYSHQTFPSSANIAAVYAQNDCSSPLRRYMARSYQILADLDDGQVETVGWTAQAIDSIISEVPAMFKDFRALIRKSKGEESKEVSLDLVCSYHAHGVDEECFSNGLNFRGKPSFVNTCLEKPLADDS